MTTFDSNYAWARNVARNLAAAVHRNERDDAYQCAMLAYWQACGRADESKGSATTYAYRRMKGAIIDMQRMNFLVGSRRVHVEVQPDFVLYGMARDWPGFDLVDELDEIQQYGLDRPLAHVVR